MSQSRVTRTLYRQLLSWCRRYEDVPFDGIPPLTLTPPQINSRALQRLRKMRTFLDDNRIKDSVKQAKWRHPAHFALYNTDIHVSRDDDLVVFPAVHDANKLRDVIRSVFWLNNMNATVDIGDGENSNEQKIDSLYHPPKDQIALAFEAIKSCNQLSSNELDDRRSRRQSSIAIRQEQMHDVIGTPDVKYHVGQVVSQKKKGWRGVIVGWTIADKQLIKNPSQKKLTSLTTKQYALSKKSLNEAAKKSEKAVYDNCPKTDVKYTILVDVNDAALLESSKIVSLESQDELVSVENGLQRIHNNLTNQYFKKFKRDHFEPNNILRYVYPMDRYSNGQESKLVKKHIDQKAQNVETSCARITRGVEIISKELISSYEHCIGEDKRNDNFVRRSLSDFADQASFSSKQTIDAVYSSLSSLFHFHVKVNSSLWTRKQHLEHTSKVKFSLGQIVKHKLYDYRGIVVAWDRKPCVDVRNWDGLQQVENPHNKPFYHIRPDENDCVRAFGGPRSFRYVCQDNLELCESTELAVDGLNRQEWAWDNVKKAYTPTEEMRFLFGEALEFDKEQTIELGLQTIRNTLSDCLLSVRDRKELNLYSLKPLFGMDDLFTVLKSADTLDHATSIEGIIKEIWKESSNRKLRSKLDTGIAFLVEGDIDQALSVFTKITAADPHYGEAWNKKSTAHYMAGHVQESLEAARKALEVEPRNFQALAGIGLVEMDSSSSVENAIKAFRECISLNPWSSVSAQLAACLRKQEKAVEDSDAGKAGADS